MRPPRVAVSRSTRWMLRHDSEVLAQGRPTLMPSGGDRITRLLDRGLDRLSRTNYQLAHYYYRSKLRRQDRATAGAPILVYQMGKVGSSTVVKSLRAAGVDSRVYHVHFLTPTLIEEYEEKRRCYLRTKRVGDLRHIWLYKHLRDRLEHEPPNGSWKVITLVRDPVARNLATFFEHIEVVSESNTAWSLNSAEYDFEITVEKRDLEPLIELFFRKCRHDNPLIYFDREFKTVLGLDVYAKPFPHAEGFATYESGRFDVLLLRLEDLNRVARDAITSFLGLKHFDLVNSNIGQEKDYADAYDRFKRSIRLPVDYLDRMYSSKFARHFYSRDELAAFRKRWLR